MIAIRITERLKAAFNAFTGKVPAGKAIPEPFFYNFSASILGVPTQNTQVNQMQLRAFSESAIPRRAIDYIRNQVTRLDWDIDAKSGKKLTAAQRKQITVIKEILNSPNPDDNWMSFLGQMIEDMLVIGMGVAEIIEWPSQTDHPYLLYPVDASSIQIYMDWDGSPGKPKFAQFDLHGNHVDFKPSELLVFKHNPRSNTPFGLSPVEVSIQQIQYFLDAQSYAGKTASSATPKKLLFMGQELSDKQLVEFRQYFRDEIEGRSHIPIVGGTDDVKSIELGLTGDQALFLGWQQFLVAVIANAFNLDIMKFNAIVGINRSTGDTLDDASDEGAIRPMAQQIEHYLNQFFLSMFGISDVAEFKFRFTTSFQDRKSLAVIHQIYGQLDTLTINEMRRELGKPDLPLDENLGYSKGDLTLSEYRAIFGGQNSLNDAVDVDEDTGTTNPNSVQDPNKNGGNNGVHGAPVPKEKATNQRTDKAADVSL